jgi:hypothetical protein
MKTKIFSLAILMTVLVSCQKESVTKKNTDELSNINIANERYNSYGCEAQVVPFIAGQHIDAGTIEVTNDAEYIYVTYNTANGYVLRETHLYVGDCEAVPVNKKGNPVPGQFPDKNTHNNATNFTYKVPISAIGLGKCGCIAAHAAVVKLDSNGKVVDSQTAWGAGTTITAGNGNWGTKFEYCTCIGIS